jgi:hypothetical protein
MQRPIALGWLDSIVNKNKDLQLKAGRRSGSGGEGLQSGHYALNAVATALTAEAGTSA